MERKVGPGFGSLKGAVFTTEPADPYERLASVVACQIGCPPGNAPFSPCPCPPVADAVSPPSRWLSCAHESITVVRAEPIWAYRQVSFDVTDDKRRQLQSWRQPGSGVQRGEWQPCSDRGIAESCPAREGLEGLEACRSLGRE